MKRFLLYTMLLALLLTGCGEVEPPETEPTQPPYVTAAGETFPRDAQSLDLRDLALTPAEYDMLCRELPDCEILWAIPFQGQRLDMTTRQLRVESMTMEELENLTYLPSLEAIHIRTYPGQAVLDALENTLPEVRISYMVSLGSRKIQGDAQTLTLEAGELTEAMEPLKQMPQLKDVTIPSLLEDLDAILALKEAYPEITFHFTFPFFGQEVSSDAEEVELNRVPIASTQEVEQLLPLFNNLKKLALLRSGLPSEELDALWKRHPETRIVWTIRMAGVYVRTDVTTMMPFQYGYDGYYEELRIGNREMAEFQYLVDVVCMDLGHHNVSNIEFVRYMPNLKYLIIADTYVSDLSPLEDAKNLVYLEAFLDGITDLSPLAGCTALMDVNLCYNRISDISPLLELEHLENIWIAGNYQVPKEQWELLAETFPNAVINRVTDSSTGMGWRNIPRYYEQRDVLGMFYMTG